MTEAKPIWLKKSKSGLSTGTKIRLKIWGLVRVLLFKGCPFSSMRNALLRLFGADIHASCFVHPRAIIHMPWNLEMGERSSIDFDSVVYNLDKVRIGRFVSIAYRVNINTGFHDLSDPYFALITKPVVIKDGAFIGTEAYIAPGADIGESTVIGSASNVTKGMPDGFICYGNPCAPHKKRLVSGPDDDGAAPTGQDESPTGAPRA